MPSLDYPECAQILKSSNFSDEHEVPEFSSIFPCCSIEQEDLEPSWEADEQHRLSTLASEFSKLSAEFAKQSDRLQLLEQRFTELQESIVNKEGSARNDMLFNASGGFASAAGGCPPWQFSSESTSTKRPSWFVTYDLDHKPLRYIWEESLWDASVFIGSAQISIGGSVATSACLVLYLFLVILYVSECSVAFTSSHLNEDSKHDFQLWRSTVGHDVNLRDAFTGESLVSKVCNDNLSSPYSNLQLMVVQQLREYLDASSASPVDFLSGLIAGKVMVSLALCLWMLTLTVEVRRILDLSSACLCLEIGSRTCFLRDRADIFHLTTLSYARIVYVFLTLAVRVGIMLVLGWVGISFLIRTTDLQEMLLNALGLEYVLNLDELLFAALLPKRPRAFRERIAPISYISRCPHWNAGNQFFVFSVVLAALYYAIKEVMLNPFVDTLKQNLDALCGGGEHGSYDFVVLVDSIGIPWAAATPSAHGMAGLVRDTR